MIDGAFESEHSLAISKSYRTDQHTIFEQHLAIDTRLRICDDGLVALAVLRNVYLPHRGKVQAIEEGSIVEQAGAEWALRIQQVEHAIGSSTRLLDSRIPLTEHASTPGHCVVCLQNISCSIDIRSARTHSSVYLDATPTWDATAFDKIDDGVDTNGYDNHIARDTRTAGCQNSCNLAIFAGDLGYFLFKAHVDAIALLLLEDQIRGSNIEHFGPESAVAQQVDNLVATVAQGFDGLQRQSATASNNDAAYIGETTLDSLVVSNCTQGADTCQVKARALEGTGTSAAGDEQAMIFHLSPALQLNAMLSRLYAHYALAEEANTLVLVKAR